MTNQRTHDDGKLANSCVEARATLQRSWETARLREVITNLHGEARHRENSADLNEPHPPLEELRQHFASCTACGDEARALLDFDLFLEREFDSLESFLPGPSNSCIEATVDEALAPSPERELLTRLRRGARVVLWGMFFGLAFLATCALAIATYHALADLAIAL